MKSAMSKEVDLGKEPVGRLLLTLAVPAILSQLVNALYNMVDRMYIGHIHEVGAEALTGVGICFPIIMIVSAFAFLMGIGGSPRAGILMGKGDNKGAEKIMGNCFMALILVSVLLTAVVLIFKTPILYFFKATDVTIGYAKSYISIYAIGTIFVQLTLGLNAFISTQGFSKISMMTVVIGAVINIVLDPIFIFLLGMGVKGAALATVISQAVSCLWAFRFLTSDKTVLKLRKENIKIEPKVLMPCIALGIAPFVMQSTESILVLCFNSQLLKFGGDMAVGAMTILSSIMQFAMLPLQGLTQGGQPIISFNYGAGNPKRVKKAFKLVMIASLVYFAALWLLAELAPGVMVSVFTSDMELREISMWAIRIYLGALVLMGAQIACQQTFIAFGNAKVSVFLAIFRKIIVLIPLIYILPMFVGEASKVAAVFWAEPIADTIAVTTTCLMFAYSFKKLLRKMSSKGEIKATTN